MIDVDKLIYVVALESCTNMEKDAETAKTDKEKRRVVMKYKHHIPLRSKPEFMDAFDGTNLWTASAIGIGMYMYEFIEQFEKMNGITHEATV